MGHADPVLVIGTVFQGGYEILSELGRGTFGRVYRARQISTGQEVAIKILHLRWADTPEEVHTGTERFRREMRLCVELSHPNIVRLIDSGESEEGVLYAVFQLVPGVTLKDLLAAEGALSVAEAVHLMTQVLDALSCAHLRGIVHRDLKPENIMVIKTGARRNAMVLDFGLGGFTREADRQEVPRITRTREMMGTPCYAAPEQLRGEPPSTRSDLYSWGLIFLECLTGELAVRGASAQEVILKQIGPDPVVIPAWLRAQRLGRLLATVTAKPAERRDVTIDGLLQTLSASAASDPDPTQQRAPIDAGLEGERRQLTLVCCHLTVGGAHASVPDVDEADQLLHARYAAWAELAARGGGHVAGIMADRILFVFGYPQAREDDPRRAVRTALQVIDEAKRARAHQRTEPRLRLETRIGIHTGVVIVRALRLATRNALDDIVGPTPEIALRLAERAAPGEILASSETVSLLRGEIPATPAGALPLSQSAALSVFRLGSPLRATAGLETIPPARDTPLIGRLTQLDALRGQWTRAAAGTPTALLIRGEPGIGKSRLVRELRRQTAGEAWLECRCVLENQGNPLRPFVDGLASAAEPVESMLQRYGFNLEETAPLLAALMSQLFSRPYPELPLSAERRKELTLNTLLTLFLRMAEAQPRVVVVEDLQWADPTSLELAGLLIQEVRSAQLLEGQPAPRICIIFTARPEFNPPWAPDDLSVIHLSRLERGEVEEMITAGLAGETTLGPELRDEIVRRADGIPLFVEEVTRVLMRVLAAEGGRRLSAGDLALEIPTTLRGLLAARLDALSPGARETAQLAAVLGREFRYEVLRAIADKDEIVLREDLGELISAGLAFHRRSVRSESYVFKHALVRDTAYESLLRSRRRELHRRVANTLRQRFPDIEQHRPDILAQHFEHAGDPPTAASYYCRAGDRAMKRAAYGEATHLLERGLRVVETVAESPARDRLEIELLTTLGTVQFSTKGYGAEEVERAFGRARLLCERLDEELSPAVLTGIMGVHFTRSDREATDALLPLFRGLSQRTGDPIAAITGYATLGLNAFFRGELLEARDLLNTARRYYHTEEFQRGARDWGYDGGLLVFAYQMWTLFDLGYPDQADAVRKEMLSIAEASNEAYSILIALSFSTRLTHERGEPETTLELAGRLLQRSTEEKLYVWMASAMVSQGGAWLQQGQAEAAIEVIRQGIDIYRLAGVFFLASFYLTYLAAAYAAAGEIAKGLATVDEGLSLCAHQLARYHEPELLRLRGDLLRLQGDTEAAEASLCEALHLAQQRSAKSAELRAALSLGRLLRDQGRIEEARALLTAVYGWFTEGFATQDLRAAATLLAQLSPAGSSAALPTS